MKRSTAFVLALGIVVLLAGINANFFFRQPYYEFWDLAANSLSILRAKHFAQLYGPYSRYGFYHPGAGYFYIDALGEWLFHDVLHVVPAPYNGQLLLHLCLMAAFFVAGLEVFTHWLPAGRRWVFTCMALILAILHFGMTGNLPSFVEPLGGPTAFLSNWSAHFLVLPFFCLLTAGASVANGRGRDLSLLVVAGGFLVHAHVAEPLFVVPTALLAYGGLTIHAVRRQRIGAATGRERAWQRMSRFLGAAWRENPRAHLLAGMLLAVFLLPIFLDLCRGRNSNLAAILRHMHAQVVDHKSFSRSVVYFFQYAAYSPYQHARLDFGYYTLPGLLSYLRAHLFFYLGWLLVAFLLALAPFEFFRSATRLRLRAASPPSPNPDDSTSLDLLHTRRFLAIGAGFAAMVVMLTLYWGTRQEGPMYYYNSWFNFGLYYFAALLAAAIICIRQLPSSQPTSASGRPTPGWKGLAVQAVGVIAVVVTWYLFADRMRIRDRYIGDGNVAMHDGIRHAIAASAAAYPGAYKFLTAPVAVWSQSVAVGLELARSGEPYAVPEGWEVVFGEDHGWSSLRQKNPGQGFCPWYILLKWPPRPGVPPDAPAFTLHPGVAVMFTPPSIALSAIGDKAEINFAPKGNADDFVLSGWSGVEPAGRWSDQRTAALCFRPLEITGGGVEISLDVIPFVAPMAHGWINRQRLMVSFNGEQIGPVHAVAVPQVIHFTVSAALWNMAAAGANPLAALEFEFPDALSPASLDPGGSNLDARQLGVHFSNVQMRVVP